MSCNANSLTRSAVILAPSGAAACSPGREPWGKQPSPCLRHPSPARAGEGTGVRESILTHGSRRGLHAAAPDGAAEAFSQHGIYSTKLCYRPQGVSIRALVRHAEVGIQFVLD